MFITYADYQCVLSTRFDEDKNEYLFRITECVRQSLDRLYEVEKPECTLVFTEQKPAHDEVIKRVLYQHAQQRGDGHGTPGARHDGEEGDAGDADSDVERSKLYDLGIGRDEPDDDRAETEADNARRIDDILDGAEGTDNA